MIFFWGQLDLPLFSSTCPSCGFLGPGGVLGSTLSPFVFVCLSPSCRLLGPGDVLWESALSPLVFFYLSPSCHLLALGDFLRAQLCLLLFSSTFLLPVTCLGLVIFLGLCLCFPLLVKFSSFVFLYLSPSCHLLEPRDFLLESTLSPFSCPLLVLPVGCLGRAMFFGSQLCLPLFSSTCLLPVGSLGRVVFLGPLCLPLFLSSCPLPVTCLGRVMFLGSQLCLPLFSSTCLHPVACLGSAIFLGVNFVCLCFPLLVKLSSCLLPVACLGGVMFFGSQLCLPFLPFKLLLPVTCLGGVILFWVHFVSLCFSSSPFCRLLGPGDFFL